jgi:hypothetical protein
MESVELFIRVGLYIRDRAQEFRPPAGANAAEFHSVTQSKSVKIMPFFLLPLPSSVLFKAPLLFAPRKAEAEFDFAHF